VGYINYNLCNKEGYAQSVWLRNYGEADTAAIGDVIGKYRHIHPDDRTVLLNRLGPRGGRGGKDFVAGWRSSSPGRYRRHRSPAASCTTTAGRHGSKATSSAANTGRRSR